MSEKSVPRSSRQPLRVEQGGNPLLEAGADADRSRDVIQQQQQASPSSIPNINVQSPSTSAARRGRYQRDAAPWRGRNQRDAAPRRGRNQRDAAPRRGRNYDDAASATSALLGSDCSDTRAMRARLNRQNAMRRSLHKIATVRRSTIRSSRRHLEQKRQRSSVRSRLADAKTHKADATSDEAAAAGTPRVHAPPRHRSKYRNTLSVHTIAKKFKKHE